MHGAGFEPAHPEIVGLKSTALDHSAIRARVTIFYFIYFLERPIIILTLRYTHNIISLSYILY